MTANTKIPILRFSEFEGEWEERKLGEMCSTFKSGNGITGNEIKETGNFPVYGGNGLRGFTNSYTHEGFYVLIGRQGALCGNINRANGKTYISEHAIAVQANELSDSEWLAQKLELMKLNQYSESSAQPGLSVNKLVKLKIIAPSLYEQQRIASFLTSVDDKIQQLTKKKALLEQYKKGVMQQIFNQEIRFKDDDGNNYPDWEKQELGLVSIINPRSVKLPNSFIYIDLESVENGILLKEQRIISRHAPSRAQRLLEKDDILFQMVRPYQKNNLYFQKEGEYVASTGYAQIRAKEDAKYLYNYLHLDTFVNEVLLRCTGTSYPAISSGDLSKIKIQLPTKEEQQKIGNFLTGIHNKIDLINQQLEKTKEFKKGLLQQMFV